VKEEAHRAACFVEVQDDRGRIIMYAKGEAVSIVVMKVRARAVGTALVSGHLDRSRCFVTSEAGEFLGEGLAAAEPVFATEGETITMNIVIEPQIRQQSMPKRPRERAPFSLCALYVPKWVIRRLGRVVKLLIYWRAREDSNP